jgi:hypothetical protein
VLSGWRCRTLNDDLLRLPPKFRAIAYGKSESLLLGPALHNSGWPGAILGHAMLVAWGWGNVLLPQLAACGAPVFIDSRLFRQPASRRPPRPVLMVIGMDVAIVLAAIGYSLSRGCLL